MKLSAVLLQEKLNDIIVSCHYGRKPEQLNLERPEFLAENKLMKNGYLHISKPECLPTWHCLPDEGCLICIGEPLQEYMVSGCTVILLRKELDIFDVFNRVSAVFTFYDNWERQLLQCISDKTPMQRFVDASTGVFENPIYIVDSTLRQLAHSGDDVFSNIPGDLIAEDIEGLAKLYASAQGVSENDDATILWNDKLKLHVITKALRSHNHFAITVTLVEAGRPFRESDIILLDYMSYYVLKAFDYGHTATNEEESPVSLATVLTQLLRKEYVTDDKIKSAQSAFGWEPEHLLCICYVKTSRPEHNFTTRIYHCQQMERQYTSAIAIASLDENYVVIVNISLSEKYDDSTVRFISILEKHDFVCGVSCEFSDLARVADYFQQSKYAYSYGRIINPGKKIYYFSNYRLQFMLSHCCGGQELEFLYPKGLKELIAYDQLRGTLYLISLIAYCDCKFNATHAAEHLHIHRTTFLERFSKIRDFLETDFEDPSDRLHLLMSLELLKSQKL